MLAEPRLPPVRFECVLSGGVRNGIYKPREFHGRGHKIVNMGELFAHRRLHDVDMKRVELTRSEAERFELHVGDLLFARRSLTAEGAGKCSLVCELGEPTTFESSIIRARINVGVADPGFVFYWFNSPAGLEALDGIKRQVAVAGITGTDLVQLEIPLPPLHDQLRIAEVLGSLDDKIELNRRMNQTLEEMARTVFKAWFVDFLPVKAKQDGAKSFPGMDADTFALFPNSFDDSPSVPSPRAGEPRPSVKSSTSPWASRPQVQATTSRAREYRSFRAARTSEVAIQPIESIALRLAALRTRATHSLAFAPPLATSTWRWSAVA